MCGIAEAVGIEPRDQTVAVRAMRDRLVHRGQTPAGNSSTRLPRSASPAFASSTSSREISLRRMRTATVTGQILVGENNTTIEFDSNAAGSAVITANLASNASITGTATKDMGRGHNDPRPERLRFLQTR